jgi:hypothetical protein
MKNRGMSYTEAVRELRHPSAEAPPEPQAQSARCSVATGSLPVSSVHLLLSRWHAEAAKGHQCAKAWGSPGNPAPFHQGWAQALEHCIEELRAEMASANKRQPEENTEASERAAKTSR